ncbi:hypothetical protein GQ457_05G027330 [Hibiscus cannabinus]
MARRTGFFKILIFDFLTPFVKNLEKNLLEKLPQKSKLEIGDGRFWHVDVEKIDDNLCFKNGWKQFVQQNSLKMGDLVVFNYHGNFRFELEIYGRNCCRKRVETTAGEPMPGYRQRPIRNVRKKNVGNLNYVQQRRGEGGSKAGEVVYIEISDSDDETDDGESLFGQRENLMKTSGLETAQMAPSPLINPRKSSTCPRLDTILEEGCEHHAVFPKKLLVFVPLVLSTAVYFLLNKDATLCA